MFIMNNNNLSKRVVVTGLGIITAIGNNLDEFWTNALKGVSGGDYITFFDATNFATKIACEIKNFDPLLFLNKKEIQRMDRFTQLAIAASTMAIEDSNLNFEKLDKNRIGCIIGSGIGGMCTYYQQTLELVNRNGVPDRISPFFIPMLLSDIAAGHVAIRWGLKGPNYSTTAACATSGYALADSVMLLERGDADIMIAGGAESVITQMGVGGFNAMKALSTRNDSPKTASRPFDKDRDGFVIGEGSGVLVLETLEHANKRNAKIYAEIGGFGLTDDAFHITQPAPNGEGAARAMKLAIKNSNLTINDIDYINAHGTSTYFNDKNETIAIKDVFGEELAHKISISSTKSMTGHLLGAASSVEAIASILSIYNNIIPPTINIETPDPECDLDYTPNKPVKKEVRAAISNNFGFGGHNISICFKKHIE